MRVSVCAAVVLAVSATLALVGGNVLIEPYCDNSIRLRISSKGQPVLRNQVGALRETAPTTNGAGEATATAPTATTNGNMKVTVDDDANTITVTRVSDSAILLQGPMPTFGADGCSGPPPPPAPGPTCVDSCMVGNFNEHTDVMDCTLTDGAHELVNVTRAACCAACDKSSQCNAFTWGRDEADQQHRHKCWLCKSISGSTPRADRDSGCVVRSRDTVPPFVAPPSPPSPPSPQYHGINVNFKTAAKDRLYGLGQLESEHPGVDDGKGIHSCVDPSSEDKQPCGTPLNRRLLPGKTASLSSSKYHIAIPWLYSATAGFGVFFNQPGSGNVGLNAGEIAYNFTCQKQLDMWVGTYPAGSADAAENPAPSVYEAFATATGKPAMLPEYAAEYWQSKDAYQNQTEVLQLAQNFSNRNLSVGVIVIDLGVPTTPAGTKYYRLDPARFPDVPAMSAAVTKLTGAYLMPNLKPTGVATSDCPACSFGNARYSTDGGASDGRLDASSAECRQCVWEKRLMPGLFDQGVKTFWLDDDEQDRFHTGFECGPPEYCGMATAGLLYPSMYGQGQSNESFAPLFLSRNLWAGAAQYGAALWSSDILSTWTEFRAQVPTGISSGLSGWPYWSSDVAGFEGIPTPELASRWHQFGSVCSIYRTHGARPYNEPWSYGPAAEASIVKSIQLRVQLKPYIMALAANATKYGTPLMRPLWFDFPTEMLAMAEVEDAFMFGPKYLAAPVLEDGARVRTVYLPRTDGGWAHYYTGAKYAGGANVTVPAPLDELPLFVRAGY